MSKHVGPGGMVAMLEFTRKNLVSLERLLVIIALYAHRPRLAACEDFSVDQDVSSRLLCEGWEAV